MKHIILEGWMDEWISRFLLCIQRTQLTSGCIFRLLAGWLARWLNGRLAEFLAVWLYILLVVWLANWLAALHCTGPPDWIQGYIYTLGRRGLRVSNSPVSS